MSQGDDSVSVFPTVLLVLAATFGFILSNSPLVDHYSSLLATTITLIIGDYELLKKSFLLLINDGLMAVFFCFYRT